MTLYVVRHGRTEANASGLLLGRADPELDEVGRAQAARIAAALPPGARVVSSPLARCRQTAEALAAHPETDDRLLEMDYGDFDLTPVAEVSDEVWAVWRSDPDFRPPNGESHRELGERVGAVLDELCADAASGDVIVVTHVSPIKASGHSGSASRSRGVASLRRRPSLASASPTEARPCTRSTRPIISSWLAGCSGRTPPSCRRGPRPCRW
jgi:broad specificity phosphatase PhoE